MLKTFGFKFIQRLSHVVKCQQKLFLIYNHKIAGGENPPAQIKMKHHSLIQVNNGYEGQSIETKSLQAATSNQPIEEGSPQIYTERKDGVLPETDIRTDRFDIAIEKMDYISRMNTAKREAKFTKPTEQQPTEQQTQTNE